MNRKVLIGLAVLIILAACSAPAVGESGAQAGEAAVLIRISPRMS